MIVQDVFDALRPRHSLSKFSVLINEILNLEDRLNRLNDQSEYFRWAESNHQAQLKKLKRRYTEFRYIFNDCSVDDLLDEINEIHGFIHNINPTIESRNIRYFAEVRSEEIIAEIEDMIHLKSVIQELPAFNDLRLNPELISTILN